MGVTGTLILGTIHLAGLTSKAKQDDELAHARRTIEQLMNNRNICKATIKGMDLTTAGTTINFIQGLNGEKYFESSGVNSTIDDALSGNTTAEDTLIPKLHAKYGNHVMVGEMLIKDKGEITDKQKGSTIGSTTITSIKGENVLRLLEFSVLLAIKDARAKAGQKVKGYTKSITFTGVVDNKNFSPAQIKSCVANITLGQKETERSLCTEMGGEHAWDDISGNCKPDVIKREIAIRTVKGLCDDDGLGTYTASSNSCRPHYWGKHCRTCANKTEDCGDCTGSWTSRGENVCTQTTRYMDSSNCMIEKREDCTLGIGIGGVNKCPGPCGYWWVKAIDGQGTVTCVSKTDTTGCDPADYSAPGYSPSITPRPTKLGWLSGPPPTNPPCTVTTALPPVPTPPTTPTPPPPPPTCTNTCLPGKTLGPYPGCLCSRPKRCPSGNRITSSSIPQSECGPSQKCGWVRGACRMTCQGVAMKNNIPKNKASLFSNTYMNSCPSTHPQRLRVSSEFAELRVNNISSVCCAQTNLQICARRCAPPKQQGPYPRCACMPPVCPKRITTRRIGGHIQVMDSSIPQWKCGPSTKCRWRNGACRWTCQGLLTSGLMRGRHRHGAIYSTFSDKSRCLNNPRYYPRYYYPPYDFYDIGGCCFHL